MFESHTFARSIMAQTFCPVLAYQNSCQCQLAIDPAGIDQRGQGHIVVPILPQFLELNIDSMAGDR
jgi:hypothetical protein